MGHNGFSHMWIMVLACGGALLLVLSASTSWLCPKIGLLELL